MDLRLYFKKRKVEAESSASIKEEEVTERMRRTGKRRVAPC